MMEQVVGVAVDGADLRNQRTTRESVSMRLASRKLVSYLLRHHGLYVATDVGGISRSTDMTEMVRRLADTMKGLIHVLL